MQMRIPDKPSSADKVFVVVRNPIDVFASLFLFTNTASHSLISEEKISESFKEEWDYNIRVMAKAYNDYHVHIKNISK
jgi:hypothetical protein